MFHSRENRVTSTLMKKKEAQMGQDLKAEKIQNTDMNFEITQKLLVRN